MFRVKLVQVNDFNDQQSLKLFEAKSLMEKVLNSQQFKEAVLDYSWTFTTYTGPFWKRQSKRIIYHSFYQNFIKWRSDLTSMSNSEVYNHIMRGSELLTPEGDGVANISITLYAQNNSTIGYTYPTTPMQWINNKFFKTFSPPQVASNLFHEWLHKIGFTHDSKRTAKRNHSVPYALGKIMEDLATKFYKEPSAWKLVRNEEKIFTQDELSKMTVGELDLHKKYLDQLRESLMITGVEVNNLAKVENEIERRLKAHLYETN